MSTLKISGLVQRAATFTRDDLAGLPTEYQIEDVSSVDPARRGRGVWLQGILSAVGVADQASYLGLHAAHDDFHASIPLAPILNRGFVIYEQDGEPLAVAAGGPFRFAIQDFAACHTSEIDECANVKFVDHLELTAEAGRDNRPSDDAEHETLHRSAGS